MDLSSFKNTNTKKRRKRVGRGDSSGLGRTCGRGEKGQKSRSGSKIRPYFEGGQVPLFRRLPHAKGFKSRNHKNWTLVNLDSLEKAFDDGATIDEQSLLEQKLITSKKYGLKVLANGKITKKFTIKANAFSKTAKQQIEAVGGTCQIIDIFAPETEENK